MAPEETAVSETKRPLGWTSGELQDRERKLGLEWLETDGLGGFAGGTVAGARLRRSHGWFAPAIPPPRRRFLLVAGCEEFVTVRRVRTGISMQIYGDAVFPEGDQILADFALTPFPTWLYKADGFEIERTLCLVRDRSVTIVRYVNRGERDLNLEVRPLVAFRGIQDLARESPDFETETELRGELAWVRPVAYLPRLYLRGAGAATEKAPAWYRSFRYRLEGEEPDPVSEDLWSPLAWTWTLPAGGEAYALFSIHEIAADPAQLLEA